MIIAGAAQGRSDAALRADRRDGGLRDGGRRQHRARPAREPDRIRRQGPEPAVQGDRHLREHPAVRPADPGRRARHDRAHRGAHANAAALARPRGRDRRGFGARRALHLRRSTGRCWSSATSPTCRRAFPLPVLPSIGDLGYLALPARSRSPSSASCRAPRSRPAYRTPTASRPTPTGTSSARASAASSPGSSAVCRWAARCRGRRSSSPPGARTRLALFIAAAVMALRDPRRVGRGRPRRDVRARGAAHRRRRAGDQARAHPVGRRRRAPADDRDGGHLRAHPASSPCSSRSSWASASASSCSSPSSRTGLRVRQLEFHEDGTACARSTRPGYRPPHEVVVLQPYGNLAYASAPVFEGLLPKVDDRSRGSVVIVRLRVSTTSACRRSPCSTATSTTSNSTIPRSGSWSPANGSADQLGPAACSHRLGPDRVFESSEWVGEPCIVRTATPRMVRQRR